jgi:prepilin-type N-terminal cleavage/methylation domain-containing protein
MKSQESKYGMTLVEMLIVMAIIALLATMVIGIASQLDNQSKERIAGSTMAILAAALEEFKDYGYSYRPPYSNFDFPLDCSGFPVDVLEATLSGALGAASVEITNHDTAECLKYSASEVLYFFLNRVPESRKTLDKIGSSLVTNVNDVGARIEISIDGGPFSPLLRFTDPWGTTLRYDYYNEGELDPILREKGKRTFPVIVSAGPDRRFGTTDDISNR